MNKAAKIIVEVLLALVACGLVYLIVRSVSKPVEFKKEQARREQVGIQRLKDIRTLQVAFKGVHNHYTPSVDSLIQFYNDGKMEIVMQIGSNDDSLAVVNTAAIKKKNRKITPEQLYQMYLGGEKNLVFNITTPIAVKDTLFNDRADFVVDSLAYIPFSGGAKVEMESIIKSVSGVQVPLFEARMPYKALLRGMDYQLIVNLNAEREKSNKYIGLQVGSITMPNNNAGNWE